MHIRCYHQYFKIKLLTFNREPNPENFAFLVRMQTKEAEVRMIKTQQKIHFNLSWYLNLNWQCFGRLHGKQDVHSSIPRSGLKIILKYPSNMLNLCLRLMFQEENLNLN